MIKKLLLIICFSLFLSLHAQNVETITIDWTFGSNPSASGNANADRTIEVGDTVTWEWQNNGSHNVNSLSSATEDFESSFQTTGTFSYTFQSVGTNPYQCDPHAGNMFGTITVVADGTLSNSSFSVQKEFRIYPNPSADYMNVEVPNLAGESLKLEVFDVLGKKVLTQNINKLSSKINVSKWNSGVYLVRLTASDDTVAPTKRFVKL
ncbi:MAG: T9SS type A sorting domain-containing protein [Bacteroidota bacterium]